ncbi:MAG: hypothetical protein JWR07_4021 [Nevskia sp.]|nr:hypothetical protein [Nevskia sp.]
MTVGTSASIDTIGALRTYNGAAPGTGQVYVFDVQGYNTAADGGGGAFSYGSAATADALFTGSVSGTTLTVAATPPVNGTVRVGQAVSGPGVLAGTYIVSQISGTGGAGTYKVNISQTAALQAMTPDNGGTIIVDANLRRWYRDFSGLPSVKHFGAVGNGVSDDSVAINSAITYLNLAGGGTLWLPPSTYVCNIKLKSRVKLQGAGRSYRADATYITTTLFQPVSGGHVIELFDTYPVRTIEPQICDMNILGRGGGSTGSGAVSGRGVSFGAAQFMGAIERVAISNFGDEGLYVGGTAIRCVDCLVTNCVQNWAGLTRYKGASFIAGSDHKIDYLESQTSTFQGATSSFNTVTSPDRRAVGILASVTAGFFRDCVGELSDTGWLIYGSIGVGAFGTDEFAYGVSEGTQFIGCRGDRNASSGWRFVNGARQYRLSECLSLNNCGGASADGEYDGFEEESGCFGFFSSCMYDSDLSAYNPKKPKYGFSCWPVSSPAVSKSEYSFCVSRNHSTAWFGTYDSTYGDNMALYPVVPSISKNFIPDTVDGNATPDANRVGVLRLGNTSATTVTNFVNGVNGQDIDVIDVLGHTTIAKGSNISTLSGQNIRMRSNEIRRFKFYRGVWYEVGERSYYAAVPNSSVVIPSGASVSSSDITISGAVPGDWVDAACDVDLQGCLLTGYVKGANTVKAVFANLTGSGVTLASGNLYIKIRPH